jgi:hypothetical protein
VFYCALSTPHVSALISGHPQVICDTKYILKAVTNISTDPLSQIYKRAKAVSRKLHALHSPADSVGMSVSVAGFNLQGTCNCLPHVGGASRDVPYRQLQSGEP